MAPRFSDNFCTAQVKTYFVGLGVCERQILKSIFEKLGVKL